MRCRGVWRLPLQLARDTRTSIFPVSPECAGPFGSWQSIGLSLDANWLSFFVLAGTWVTSQVITTNPVIRAEGCCCRRSNEGAQAKRGQTIYKRRPDCTSKIHGRVTRQCGIGRGRGLVALVNSASPGSGWCPLSLKRISASRAGSPRIWEGHASRIVGRTSRWPEDAATVTVALEFGRVSDQPCRQNTTQVGEGVQWQSSRTKEDEPPSTVLLLRPGGIRSTTRTPRWCRAAEFTSTRWPR